MKIFFGIFWHNHKIGILNDKCAKNHLKMRSFDWFLKMLKFDKNMNKTSDKNLILSSKEFRRKNLVRFVFSKINRIDHGKEVCKLIKMFLKGLKWFWKVFKILKTSILNLIKLYQKKIFFGNFWHNNKIGILNDMCAKKSSQNEKFWLVFENVEVW